VFVRFVLACLVVVLYARFVVGSQLFRLSTTGVDSKSFSFVSSFVGFGLLNHNGSRSYRVRYPSFNDEGALAERIHTRRNRRLVSNRRKSLYVGFLGCNAHLNKPIFKSPYFVLDSVRGRYGQVEIRFPAPDCCISTFVIDAVEVFRRINAGVHGIRASANLKEWEYYRFVNGLDPVPIGSRIGVKIFVAERM
jgi:hypothetical protein